MQLPRLPGSLGTTLRVLLSRIVRRHRLTLVLSPAGPVCPATQRTRWKSDVVRSPLPRPDVLLLRQFGVRDGDCGVRPRLSSFPVDKPFDRLEPDAPISEVVFRLVVDFYSDAPVVVGTATILCRHLLVTAGHILRSRLFLESYRPPDPTSSGVAANFGRTLSVVQVLPGPEYVVWDVVSAIAHPASDLAFLHVSSNPRRSDLESPLRRNAPAVNPFAPRVGERVPGFVPRPSFVSRGHRASASLSGLPGPPLFRA